MFKLSVLAMGRNEWNISARLNAGIGEVEEDVGAEGVELDVGVRIMSG